MEDNLNELINLSQKFGKNPDYIIAGGGNSSYKNKNLMWVKASGTSMANIDEKGFVCLDRKMMRVLSEKKYSEDAKLREEEVKQDLQKAILSPDGKRPSVEASMHEVIQYKYIMHTHPTLVNGVLCAKNSKEEIKEIWGDEVVYVPYTDPGYILFKKVELALEDFRLEKRKEAQIIFLENHGVFVGADTCKEIEEIYENVEYKLNKNISSLPSEMNSDNKELLKLADQVQINGADIDSKVIDSSELVQFFVKNVNVFSKVNIPFTPDNIVYCKSRYLYLKANSDINAEITSFKNVNGYYPKVVAIEGHGLICIEENLKSATIVLDVFKDMMKISYLTTAFGGPRPMTCKQIDFIDNWEVENYRRKMSKESK
ncbi:class II aldolase/adducin family protein [Carboxylicivirga sp. RSCT41]|uniref:class II aldolase/adducin family protein n=1 Tax=Carboxylicivirga agarovorans TaxID=3417570 RepID=UPI003D354AA5